MNKNQKNKILFLFFVLVLNSNIIQAARTTCLNPTTNDEILSFADLTWTTANEGTVVTGRVSDDAIEFSGDEHGTFGTTNIGGELTISIWVNLQNSVVNHRGIFSFQKTTGNTDWTDCILFRTHTTNTIQFYTNGTTGTVNYKVPVTLNEWSHYAMVFHQDSLTTTIYKNGEVVHTNTNGIAFKQVERLSSRIGYAGGYYYFQGVMDEFKIFDYPLTESQIKCLADMCGLPNCLACNNHAVCTSCEDGYFIENDECSKCDEQCATCVTRSDNCQTCKSAENREDPPDCTCSTGFFQEGKLCMANLRQTCLNPVYPTPVYSMYDSVWTNNPTFINGPVTSQAVKLNGSQYGTIENFKMGGGDFTIVAWARYDYTSLSGKYAPIIYFKNAAGQHIIWMRCSNGTTMDLLYYTNASSTYKRCCKSQKKKY